MLVHIECVSFLPENRIILVKSPWTFESHSEHCLRKIYSGRYFWDQYWLWHWLNVFDLPFKHSRPQVVQPQGNRGGKIGVGNPGFCLIAPVNRLIVVWNVYFQFRCKRRMERPAFALCVARAWGFLAPVGFCPGHVLPRGTWLRDKWG